MGKGAAYTKDDDAKLLEVYKDNEGETLIAIAEKAQRYGVCQERDTRALSQHISRLVTPTEDETEDVNPTVAFWESVANAYESKYFGLLDAVIGTASLYKGNVNNSLSLNYRAILKYLWDTVPEMVTSQIEMLEFKEQ